MRLRSACTNVYSARVTISSTRTCPYSKPRMGDDSESKMRLGRVFVIAFLALVTMVFSAWEIRGGQGVRPADILLFTGTGTSPGDVTAVETILDANDLD